MCVNSTAERDQVVRARARLEEGKKDLLTKMAN